MKTIHKILGLLPMTVAALMLTACSSEDNMTETPQTGTPRTGEVKTVNYSVTVNQGSDAQTRATVDADMKTLRFASGDKLFITSDSRADLRGFLTLKAGDEGKASGATFTGTLEYTGADPSDNLSVKATLVGTANLGFTISSDGKAIEGAIAYPSTSFCSTVNDAVEKYSNLTGTSTYGARSFTLTQQTAFLNFAVTLNDGTATATDITVTVKNGATTLSTATVTTATISEKVMANFVLPVAATTTLNAATVTIVGNHTPAVKNIGNTTLTAKVYNVKRDVLTLGDLFYSDASVSTTLIDGKSPIGVIAYLGTDNFTENGTSVSGSEFVGHGLVMCLKNAASGVCWSTRITTVEFDGQQVTNLGDLTRSTNVSGYTNTKTLAERSGASTKYPAAYQAKNYTGLTAPTGSTGWFLPSAQQWVKMQEGLGELEESSIKWLEWFDNSHTAANKWETALSKAGSGNYDSMIPSLWYWSSSEYSESEAVRLSVDATNTGEDYGFYWLLDVLKSNTYSGFRVRPVLAF